VNVFLLNTADEADVPDFIRRYEGTSRAKAIIKARKASPFKKDGFLNVEVREMYRATSLVFNSVAFLRGHLLSLQSVVGYC
jgi:hypothetical protein